MTRRLGGALVVAFVAIALAGCNGDGSGRSTTTTTRVEPPDAPRVLVLGDSNLFRSGPEVDAALRDAGFEPTLLGVPGYGLKDLDDFWLETLPDVLEVDPDVVVVGLGTNDTEMTDDVVQFPERLDRMMEALGDRPVIWLTHVDDRPGAPASAGRTINAAVRAAPDRWSNLTVLDVAVAIANDPTILRGDGLHFSPVGMGIYAEKIAEATAGRLRPL